MGVEEKLEVIAKILLGISQHLNDISNELSDIKRILTEMS